VEEERKMILVDTRQLEGILWRLNNAECMVLEMKEQA
jgi:hypothetical protein